MVGHGGVFELARRQPSREFFQTFAPAALTFFITRITGISVQGPGFGIVRAIRLFGAQYQQ